jgi:hypothetical protein
MSRTASGENFGRTASGRDCGQTASGKNFGRTASRGDCDQTASGGDCDQTASGGDFGRTASVRDFGRTASGENFGRTASVGEIESSEAANSRLKLENLKDKAEGNSNPVVVSFSLDKTMVLVVFEDRVHQIKLSRQCFTEFNWDFNEPYFRELAGSDFLPTLKKHYTTPNSFRRFLIDAAEYGYIKEISSDEELA